MKNLIFCIVGIWIIIFVLLCPFPPLLGIPGLVWRAIIGMFGFRLIWQKKVRKVESVETGGSSHVA